MARQTSMPAILVLVLLAVAGCDATQHIASMDQKLGAVVAHNESMNENLERVVELNETMGRRFEALEHNVDDAMKRLVKAERNVHALAAIVLRHEGAIPPRGWTLEIDYEAHPSEIVIHDNIKFGFDPHWAQIYASIFGSLRQASLQDRDYADASIYRNSLAEDLEAYAQNTNGFEALENVATRLRNSDEKCSNEAAALLTGYIEDATGRGHLRLVIEQRGPEVFVRLGEGKAGGYTEYRDTVEGGGKAESVLYRMAIAKPNHERGEQIDLEAFFAGKTLEISVEERFVKLDGDGNEVAVVVVPEVFDLKLDPYWDRKGTLFFEGRVFWEGHQIATLKTTPIH